MFFRIAPHSPSPIPLSLTQTEFSARCSHTPEWTINHGSDVAEQLVPNPEDLQSIEQLTSELRDTHQQIIAAAAKESVLTENLRKLGSPQIPESSKLSVTDHEIGMWFLLKEWWDQSHKFRKP